MQTKRILGLSTTLTAWLMTCALGLGAQEAAQDTPTIAAAQAKIRAGEFAAAAEMLETITKAQPANGIGWQLLGYAYHAQGDFERALPAHLQASKFPQSAGTGFYNAACAYARLGDKERAFGCLRQAESTGAIDMAQMDGDADLASLHDDPRYAELRPAPESFTDPFVEPTRILHEWDGEAPLGQFGWIARNVGDVDGDGAADLVTSAPTFVSGRGPAGRVYVYSGRSGKLLWQQTGQSGDQLGLGIEAAGDVNADGTPDVIASAPGRSRAFVYSGKDGQVLLELVGQPGDQFGRVADLGDLDGDGHGEVMVGEPQGKAMGPNTGRAIVFSGKTGEILFTLEGERAGDKFGTAVAGWSDAESALLVVGAPDAGAGARGRVYVYDRSGNKRFVLEAEPTGAELGGMFVSVVGDVDADGVRDVYASDWSDGARGPTTGRVYVHSGRTGERLWAVAGETAGEGFGIGPADAGDVDGDGHDDLVVGAWQHASAARSGGKVTVLSGRDGSPLRAITCRVRGDTFGFDATGMGDVDGDGQIDFLLTSAWSGVKGTRSGRMFLLAGEASGPAR